MSGIKHQHLSVLGEDDFATRRGKTCSTVLTCAETHRVIDALPTRHSGPPAVRPARQRGAKVIQAAPVRSGDARRFDPAAGLLSPSPRLSDGRRAFPPALLEHGRLLGQLSNNTKELTSPGSRAPARIGLAHSFTGAPLLPYTAIHTRAAVVDHLRGGFGHHAPQPEYAVALGCELRHAHRLVHAEGVAGSAHGEGVASA